MKRNAFEKKIFKRNGQPKKERRPLLYFLASFVLPWFYSKVWGLEFKGIENLPKSGAALICSSHVTARDPIFLGCTSSRGMHFMAKAELFKNWFVSKIVTYAGAFPVERGTGGADSLEYAGKLLTNGRMLTIFIEGTRSKDGQLLKPKTGAPMLAYKYNVPVIPVAIIGKDGTIPKKGGKTVVNIGKPVSVEELGIEGESSMYFRRGAKNIMAKISDLRDEAISMMDK